MRPGGDKHENHRPSGSPERMAAYEGSRPDSRGRSEHVCATFPVALGTGSSAWESPVASVGGGGRDPEAVAERIGDHLDELPDGEFDVICAIGGRSGRVVEALEARGYDAVNVEGGTSGWIDAGLPLER